MKKLSEVWEEISQTARTHGAMGVGASELIDGHSSIYLDWLDRGHEAEMRYLRKNKAARLDPGERFPWARSIITVTVPYAANRSTNREVLASRIARYAQGDDYHAVLDDILSKLEDRLRALEPSVLTRRYVDTGPLSDRAYAAQAGLGWIGKNAMLIDPENGSYFFIGILLTSLELDVPSEEISDRCGSCTRCLDACPTVAILPDRTVDSHRCISYATIEQRGKIEEELKPHLQGMIFGCDICQEVCPWNSAPAKEYPAFASRPAYASTPVFALLRMEQSDFSRLFKNSAVKRAKRAGLLRNAILAGASPTPLEIVADLADEEGIADARRWRQQRKEGSGRE